MCHGKNADHALSNLLLCTLFLVLQLSRPVAGDQTARHQGGQMLLCTEKPRLLTKQMVLQVCLHITRYSIKSNT